jgi:DNA-binding LacI/PurR family transcriptional regulator
MSALHADLTRKTATPAWHGFIFTVGLVAVGRRRRLPFGVMDTNAPDIESVRTENGDGVRQATRHLIALGHRRFVIASPL